MKNNYHINLNPRRPSREEIEKHQDFDALLEKFQEAPPAVRRGKVRRLIIGTAIAAAVAALVIFNIGGPRPSTESPSPTAEEYFGRQEFVNPPLEEIKPQFITQKINASEGGTYAFQGGSRLVVPSSAFMDDRGQLIQGEVDIHYREMHDFVDFFVSGIPMVYDSAGQRYYLESAGMVEIFALHEGERVGLAPGKAIEVELISEISVPNINVSPRYNIYRLDTAGRQWKYQDVDHIQFLDEDLTDPADPLYESKQELIAELRAIEARAYSEESRIQAALPMPAPPVKPQPKTSDTVLSFDITEEALPDAGVDRQFYEGTLWQISPKSPPYDERAFQVTWEEFELQPVNNVEYELTLISGDTELPLIVIPVLSAEDFERAQEQYKDERAEYERKLAEREARLQAQLQELRARVRREKTVAQEAFELKVGTSSYDNPDAMLRRRIVNRFKATSLGIWNCDRPIPLEGAAVQARFVDQHGTEYDDHTAYLVNKKQNTVYRFFSGKGGSLQVSDHSDHLLWLVSKDNKLAVLPPDQLKRINRSKEEPQRLVLQLIDREIRSEEDVRNILQF